MTVLAVVFSGCGKYGCGGQATSAPAKPDTTYIRTCDPGEPGVPVDFNAHWFEPFNAAYTDYRDCIAGSTMTLIRNSAGDYESMRMVLPNQHVVTFVQLGRALTCE